MVALVRIVMIGIAAMVQVIWLVYATNSEYWVPYKTLFDVS